MCATRGWRPATQAKRLAKPPAAAREFSETGSNPTVKRSRNFSKSAHACSFRTAGKPVGTRCRKRPRGSARPALRGVQNRFAECGYSQEREGGAPWFFTRSYIILYTVNSDLSTFLLTLLKYYAAIVNYFYIIVYDNIGRMVLLTMAARK